MYYNNGLGNKNNLENTNDLEKENTNLVQVTILVTSSRRWNSNFTENLVSVCQHTRTRQT